MKRLFQVGNEYFGTKKQAKEYRDINGGHVSVGPDHYKYGAPKKKPHIGSKGHKQGESIGDGYRRRK